MKSLWLLGDGGENEGKIYMHIKGFFGYLDCIFPHLPQAKSLVPNGFFEFTMLLLVPDLCRAYQLSPFVLGKFDDLTTERLKL